jgi:heat shock protein HtpX
MQMAKRVGLFIVTNILIISTLTIVMNVLGLEPYLTERGLNYGSLLVFCAVWGFGGAFISLALSRKMAKWMMGVQVIDPKSTNAENRALVERVHALARKAKLKAMPEVGIYDSPEVNAFATGPSQSRSLVAVSTGLMERMDDVEIEGVLAHEIAHIANGDMVTMTLVQGVVNAFVMFIARIAAHFVASFVDDEKKPWVQFGATLVFEVILGFLGLIVASSFSRAREYRADIGAARLSGSDKIISALVRLKQISERPDFAIDDQPALATLKISGKQPGFARWFSTHPPLEDRILRLQRM